jgi:hypothetical protein
MTDPNPITRDGAAQAAKHELAKAIYHRNTEPIEARLVRGAGRLVNRALNAAFNHAPGGGIGALALIVVVVVAVVVVIWRVGVPRRAASIGAVLSAGRATSSTDHRVLAERAAGRGDWHTAVIEWMRVTARELEERSVLEPRAGRTATELTREAGQVLPAAAGKLDLAADTFNTVAYGGGEATAAQVDIMVAAEEAIRHSVRSKVLAT